MTSNGAGEPSFREGDGDHRRARRVRPRLDRVVAEAAQQLAMLTGEQIIGATGVRRSEDGWSVLIDVVELERVPATTSVVATYRVDVDENCDLVGYERLRRYNRGATDPS